MPTIEWFREDNTQISPSEKRFTMSYEAETGVATLVIRNALLVDEMSYKCVASNQYGTAKTIGVLVIKENKALRRSPTMSRRSISPATSAVDLRGPSLLLPVLEESEHSDSHTDKSGSENKQRLIKQSAEKNKISPVREEELAVTGRKIGCRILNDLPPSIELKEGEDLKLSCTIVSELSDSEIVWFRDGKPLKVGMKMISLSKKF